MSMIRSGSLRRGSHHERFVSSAAPSPVDGANLANLGIALDGIPRTLASRHGFAQPAARTAKILRRFARRSRQT